MKTILIVLCLSFALCGVVSCKGVNVAESVGVKYAGIRSSIYGVPLLKDPRGGANPAERWPLPEEIGSSIAKMGEYFPGARQTAIWIVGHLDEEGCRLEFPKPAGYTGTDPRIFFTDSDQPGSGERSHASHEDYLNWFDKNDIKVFLQVESGKANVETLIDLVMNEYKKHRSVIGFGVDVEWYNTTTPVGEDAGELVSDKVATSWEAKVKAHGKKYRLFLKHYDKTWMCPDGYRGDIVFVDDSCRFRSAYGYVKEFSEFAKHFYPNTVIYQIGYPIDKAWWSLLDEDADPDYALEVSVPPKALGDMLAAETKQECGIIWVDFSMDKVLPPYVKPRI